MPDLNTVKANLKKTAAPNQTYGKAAEQLLSQTIVPMGPSPTGTARPPVVRKAFKSPGPFLRSTERPDEPITAGLDMGPGPSSAGAGIPPYSPRQNALAELKYIVQVYPSDDLMDLLSRYGGG